VLALRHAAEEAGDALAGRQPDGDEKVAPLKAAHPGFGEDSYFEAIAYWRWALR